MEVEKQRNRLEGAARWIPLAGGAAAVLYGIKRGGWFGTALAVAGGNYVFRGVAGGPHVFEYLGFRSKRDRGLPYGRGIKIRRSVTVDRPADELYRFWRNLENLPRFMKHLESVQMVDDRSHWVARGPAGTTIEWDAEITLERENQLIGWRSIGGAVDHAGSVRFERAPGGRGTIVRVQFQYNPPGGRLASNLAKLFGKEPDQMLQEDLARFKQLMEAGEIPTTAGQPSGRAADARPIERPYEPVEAASEESFPASDAPAWTFGRAR